MFAKTWHSSPRQYDVVHDRAVAIPVSAGFTLDCDVLRPDAAGRFPVILCMFPFEKDVQLEPRMPTAISPERVMVEGGDPNFYVHRGYVQVFCNVRGTGASGGTFDHMGPGTTQDTYDAIEWLALQPWCDGQVATFGTSYFAMTAKRVAELKPPSLKTIFAPFATADHYRDAIFHGGIFSFRFHRHWQKSLSNLRVDKGWRDAMGAEEFARRVAVALADPEIAIQPDLVEVLRNPDHAGFMLIAEYLLHPLDGPIHHLRNSAPPEGPAIPAYFGGCWGMHTLHLPGDFRSYECWPGPRRLTIGPPYYLDRPVYQYAHESLRWFDHWLKGVPNGVMDGPPIRLFIQNTGEWRGAEEWPLPETLWTEFYLHRDGLLSEHEFWPDETHSSFHEAPAEHGALDFRTPPFVESTEICGPLVLNLHASTTDTEILFFVTLYEEFADGRQHTLTRGWLRASQRHLDADRSKPWAPYHTHDRREPLTPGEIYPFSITVVPTGVLMKPGTRLGLRIKATDRDETPTDFIDVHAYGHLWRETEATITIHHDNEHPSHLLVPVTRGNIIGTFMSGGVMPPMAPH